MSIKLSLLFIQILWFLLSVNVVQGQYVGTLTLESSLENYRRFACPSESVSFTCSINGPFLVWQIQEGNTEPDNVGIFTQTDSIEHTLSELNHQINSCHGEINSFSVLEYIDPRENTSICNSTMTIRPTSLNVSSDCDPLKVICKVLGQGENNSKNMIYKIASRPTAPRNSMCIYDEHSQLLNVVVNITDLMENNNETDISSVSIAVSNGTDLEHLRSYSISPITKINDTFSYHTRSIDHTGVNVHITTGDKCGQKSLISEEISCTFMRLQEQMCSNRSECHNNIIAVVAVPSILGVIVLVLSVTIIVGIVLWIRRRLHVQENEVHNPEENEN